MKDNTAFALSLYRLLGEKDGNLFEIDFGWSSGSTLDFATFAGDHEIPVAQFPAIWDFFCPFQRLPD